MKTIKLNENQLKRLFELDTTIGTENPSPLSLPSSQIGATAPIQDTDGNMEYGKPKTMDKVTDDLTNQSFMDGHRKW